MPTYVVERTPANGQVVRMSRGTDEWEEPRFIAKVFCQAGCLVATLHNSSTLCLPGRTLRASLATDEEILEAVLRDESVV